MNGSELANEDPYVAAQLRKWDRALLIVSIPHGAAFGAFVGRYDFDKAGQPVEARFISMCALVFLLPMVTVWLSYAHDLLRNLFLRAGHAGVFNMIKHQALYLSVFSFPMLIAVAPIQFERYFDAETLGLIGLTMLSWMFCLVWVSNDLYFKIAKALGVQTVE